MENNISQKLGLEITGHKDIDFIDININKDTKLFIDPCLIECCKDEFSKRCNVTLTDYFERLYWAYKSNNLCNVYSLLAHVGERNEARLGYGTGLNGKAKTTNGMIETLSELGSLIQSDLPLERAIDIPILTPRFSEDCMSDMLMNILYQHLSEYTINQCRMYGISTSPSIQGRYYWDSDGHTWKAYHGESLIVDGNTILLVPKRYVCTRLYYSTGHFFMSRIAPILQRQESIIVNEKEERPSKVCVRNSECIKYGSLLCATIENAKKMPALLNDYHCDMSKKYSQRYLSDEALDYLVYGA